MCPDDLSTLSADDLLAISPDEPEQLFAFAGEQARRQWRELCGHWHPDRSRHPRAGWVFAHIQDLYRAACARREAGLWDERGRLEVTARDGRRFRLHYRNRHELDIGRVYIGRQVLAYFIESDYGDLAEHAYTLMRAMPFTDERMEREMGRLLPRPVRRLETRAGTLLVLRKPPHFVALRDVVDRAGGGLAPRHVAWVVSALLHLCCYLETAGLAHQAIDIDHLLLAPQKHAVALLGGWWYAGAQDSPMRALPARSAALAPPDVMARRLADVRLDQFLLRATALELLGSRLDDTPAPMREFLTLPPSGSAVVDYEQWQNTLWQSFGERRFVPLAITPDDVYAMSS